MGFDTELGKTKFNEYMNEYNNDVNGFTYEEVINSMFNDDNININDEININIDNINENEIKNNSDTDSDNDNENDNINRIECEICTLNKSENKFYKAICNHNYCKKCLTYFYKDKISNGFIKIVCINEDCNREINIDELKLFVNNEYINKYLKFQRNYKFAQDKTGTNK